ncbi:hypothetical protein VNO77_07799 [Canavalia gladiata]|uniref:Uncharacterized protein n=1 Tax=Canavalia gladiata TaxID=3824 RepID=A0AAN9MDL9_CANGL
MALQGALRVSCAIFSPDQHMSTPTFNFDHGRDYKSYYCPLNIMTNRETIRADQDFNNQITKANSSFQYLYFWFIAMLLITLNLNLAYAVYRFNLVFRATIQFGALSCSTATGPLLHSFQKKKEKLFDLFPSGILRSSEKQA